MSSLNIKRGEEKIETYPCESADKIVDVLLWFFCIHIGCDVQNILKHINMSSKILQYVWQKIAS